MNRGRMIVLLLAVGCAALAMFLMKSMVKKPTTKVVKQEVSEIQVLVADTDIMLGGIVRGNDLKWQPWPKTGADGYITRDANPKAMQDYVGAVARVSISKGDPIRAQKLVKPEQGGVMAAILPHGVRAISIEISNEQGVSGLILPNDRVDIVLTTKNRGSKDVLTASRTLLRNVRVLAIGETFETKDGQKSIKGKTATLALTPPQVEIVTEARALGDIWLSLRALADSNEKAGRDLSRRADTGGVKMLKFGVSSQVTGIE